MPQKQDSTYTAMIVDDCSEDRYLLKRLLGKTGLSLAILEAGNGLEGLEILTTSINELKKIHPNITTPTVIFLDINMPKMNGWEFLDEIERHRPEITLDPTVVMMYSTSNACIDRKKSTEYDAIANYIVKGECTPESLKETIVANSIQAE